jgi:hypothetical protein
MLTFDRPGPDLPDIGDLENIKAPDEVECGENNEIWIKVIRSKKVMIFIDKITGKTTKTVEILQPEFERIAASYGVGPRQIGAVKAALELK